VENATSQDVVRPPWQELSASEVVDLDTEELKHVAGAFGDAGILEVEK
jgi:hypothetical protein